MWMFLHVGMALVAYPDVGGCPRALNPFRPRGYIWDGSLVPRQNPEEVHFCVHFVSVYPPVGTG